MKSRIIINEQMIAKYLAGEAKPEEAMAIHDWMTMPDNKKYFEKFEAIWHTTYPSKKPHLIDKQKDWDVLDKQTKKIPILSAIKINFVKQNRLFPKIAASLLIGLFLSTIAYSIFNKKMSVYTENSIKTVQLPDKTEITLNQNSELKYSRKYGKRQREVYFSGEAFFRVIPDNVKPFIIQTAVAKIKVTGTSFNVIVTDKQLETSVNNGEILLYTKFDSCYVRAGQIAIVHLDAEKINTGIPVDVNDWGYATGKFEFKDALLKDVFHYFKKAYPDSIQILNETIKDCKITATFDNNSVEYMLTLIAETLDLKLTKNDNTFVLDGKGCP